MRKTYFSFLILLVISSMQISYAQSVVSSEYFIYYANTANDYFDRINKNDIDGSSIETILTSSNVKDVALDMSENGGIFLLTDETVYRVSTDGNTITDIFIGNHFSGLELNAIDLDKVNKHLYFSVNNDGNGFIKHYDYDGTNGDEINLGSSTTPFGITVKVNSSDVDIFWDRH